MKPLVDIEVRSLKVSLTRGFSFPASANSPSLVVMPECPRCQKPLRMDPDLALCPENHGVLASPKFLKKQLDPGFYAKLWSWWIRRNGPPTIPCPHCRSRMTAVSILKNPPLALDCCPHCFRLWLDEGELERLKEMTGDRKPQDSSMLSPMDLDSTENFGRSLLQEQARQERINKIGQIGELLGRKHYGLFRGRRIGWSLFWFWWNS